MSKRDSNWYVPADWLWHLGLLIAILSSVVLSGVLLPVISRLKTAEVTTLYGIAIGAGTDVAVETGDIILVRSTPLDAVTIIGLARSTYRKMVQNLVWATGYNAFAIPLAAGILYPFGILLTPAAGAVLMSASTVIVAINSRFLKLAK